MKRTLILIVSLLFAGVTTGRPSAQTVSNIKPVVATASLTTATCAGGSINSTGCIGVNLGGYQHVGVNLAGTWTGTVTFEASLDGVNFIAQNMLPSNGTQTAVTTATANGTWYSTQLVGSQFRARFSTATSGTVVVSVRATQ